MQRDPNKVSGIAVHHLTAGYQRKMSLLCPCLFLFFFLSTPTLTINTTITPPHLFFFFVFPVLPNETNEYSREEQGTWTHELKWQRRALADNPAWYFNRLLALCALCWLLSLVPGALSLLSSFATVLATVARCARQLMLAIQSQARTRTF
jgi:hypothetical protein